MFLTWLTDRPIRRILTWQLLLLLLMLFPLRRLEVSVQRKPLQPLPLPYFFIFAFNPLQKEIFCLTNNCHFSQKKRRFLLPTTVRDTTTAAAMNRFPTSLEVFPSAENFSSSSACALPPELSLKNKSAPLPLGRNFRPVTKNGRSGGGGKEGRGRGSLRAVPPMPVQLGPEALSYGVQKA